MDRSIDERLDALEQALAGRAAEPPEEPFRPRTPRDVARTLLRESNSDDQGKD
jgi:hypothetical protein